MTSAFCNHFNLKTAFSKIDLGDASWVRAPFMKIISTELKIIKVGSLNVQGCQKEDKQQFIYEDALKYNLQILGITETHVEQEVRSSQPDTKPNSEGYKVTRFTMEESKVQINIHIPVFLSKNP